jgi:hypothetical protein
LFVVLGYFVVFTFDNFILQNYLQLSKDGANKGVGQLMLINAFATVCVAVFAGRLAATRVRGSGIPPCSEDQKCAIGSRDRSPIWRPVRFARVA